MDTRLFSIAQLPFRISGDDITMNCLHHLNGFAPFFCKSGLAADEQVLQYQACADIVPIDKARHTPLYQFDFEQIDCYFYLDVDDVYQFDMIPRDGSQSYSFRHEWASNLVTATSTSSTSLLRFGLWMAYGIMAAPLRRVAIHSSVIVDCIEAAEERAILFLGESGTGKSTHTRLWRENFSNCYLLNDDSPIVFFDSTNSEILVYGSPWSGKTPCYLDHSCRVGAIVRLSQAPANHIDKLSRLASIGALLPSCPPAFAYDLRLQSEILDTISGILGLTPVYHLSCLPDRDAVLCVKTVL